MSMTTDHALEAQGDPGEEAPAFLPNGHYVAPRVNLLPPEVAQRQALRRLQAGLLAGVLACGAAVGALYYVSDQGRTDAQAKLDQAVSQGQQLDSRKSTLLPVQIKRSQVQSTKAALQNATAAEVLWSKQLDDVRQHLSKGVRLSTLTITPAPVAAAGAPGAAAPAPAKGSSTAAKSSSTPAATPAAAAAPSAAGAPAALPTTGTIATVTMAGVAVNPDAVADWLETMNQLPGWSGAYAQSVTQQGDGYTFSATASVSAAALSHRSDDGSGR
jgi:Tfp pilus assembly protein PilN